MLLVLCATNRPDAMSRRVAKRTLEHVEESLKSSGSSLQAGYLDLIDLKSDLFESGSYAEKPAWFEEEFQKPISQAQGIVVVTPEYNGGFPGVLKYFIDMLRFPESLVNVPVAFIGVAAGQFGALRPIEQIELIFQYRKAHLFGERLFLPKIHDVMQEDGSLGDQEERLQHLVQYFAKFCEAHESIKPKV